MSGLIEIFMFSIILLTLIVGIFLYIIEFINSSPLQIQLLGIHLTIFGGFLLLKNLRISGFFIMTFGLGIGGFGSLKNNNSVRSFEEN